MRRTRPLVDESAALSDIEVRRVRQACDEFRLTDKTGLGVDCHLSEIYLTDRARQVVQRVTYGGPGEGGALRKRLRGGIRIAQRDQNPAAGAGCGDPETPRRRPDASCQCGQLKGNPAGLRI